MAMTLILMILSIIVSVQWKNLTCCFPVFMSLHPHPHPQMLNLFSVNIFCGGVVHGKTPEDGTLAVLIQAKFLVEEFLKMLY